MQKINFRLGLPTFALSLFGAFLSHSNSLDVGFAYGYVPDNPFTANYDAACEPGHLIDFNCGQNGLIQCSVEISGAAYPAFTLDNGMTCSLPKFRE